MTLESMKSFFEYVSVFFVSYMIGYATFLFLSVTIGSATLYKNRRLNMLKNEIDDEYYLPISILVPAHNEEVTIVETVKSLLCLEYKLYEIIVVDDGSTDSTSDVLIDKFCMQHIKMPLRHQLQCQPEMFIYETNRLKVPITLIRKKNGGKADALNMGINASKYPYFICMDADSVLQYDSLEKIARPFLENDNVIAVGSAVRPSNGTEIVNGHVVNYKLPDSKLACMQVLEYDRSFLASRILFDKYNGNLIISGAFGLFKKDIVIAAGGYDSKTMGEDMELVVKLHVYCRSHNIEYQLKYAPDAICWSQVPEALEDLIKQRRRWHIGLFDSMFKHKTMLANSKYGMVSFISYFYFLIYELFSPYIEVFGLFTIVLAFIYELINVKFMIMFMAIYVIYSVILSITAFFARIHTIDLKISFSDLIKAVFLCFVEISFLRFILAWTRMTALLRYRRMKSNWGKIKRNKINYK